MNVEKEKDRLSMKIEKNIDLMTSLEFEKNILSIERI